MKLKLSEGWASLLRLLRFLAWYGIAVALVLMLLPVAGAFLQAQYDALGASVKFFAVLGLFVTVGAWELHSRQRRRQRAHDQRSIV